MTSVRDDAASVESLRLEAEDFARRLTSAAELPPQTATDESGHVTVSVDSTGRPTGVTLSAGWRDDLEPEDLAGAVQAAAATAEQQRLDAWTQHIAATQSASGLPPAIGAGR